MLFGYNNDLFRRILGGVPGLDATHDAVKVGDRYFQIGISNTVWQIERFCTPSVSDVPHVMLTRQGHIPDSKIISVEALLNGEEFAIEQRLGEVNPTAHRRRRRDILNAA
jgi:hypothetical protein